MTTDAYGTTRSDQFPVTPGADYDATAWIRGEVDVDDSRDGTVWIVRVRWEDASGTNLGYSNAVVGSAAAGLPSSFTQKGGTVTAPTGAVYGRAEVYFYLASGWLNVDDITVTPTTTANVSETKYYSFGGDTVGMRVDGVLSWIFGDQLGSTGITYKADGSSTSRQFYYPFGGIRNPGGNPVVDTDVGFTGQRLDETTGLMFYQARYYDPLTARFISADTMVPDPGNPQDFNRYSYVRNNPLRYTDPTGNDPCENGGGGCFVKAGYMAPPPAPAAWVLYMPGTGESPFSPGSVRRVTVRAIELELALRNEGYDVGVRVMYPAIPPSNPVDSMAILLGCDRVDCSGLPDAQEWNANLRDMISGLEGTVIAMPHSQSATYFSIGIAADPKMADLFDGIVLLSPPALHAASAEGFSRTDTRMNGQSIKDFVAPLFFDRRGYLRDPWLVGGFSTYSFSGGHDSSFDRQSSSFISLVNQIGEIIDGS